MSVQPPNEPLGEPRRSKIPVAAWIAIGLSGALLVTCGVGAWIFATSDQGQKLIELGREAATLAQEASSAPGTDELRELGCEQPAIFTGDQMRRLAGVMADDEEHREQIDDEIPADAIFLQCKMGLFSDDEARPGCVDVARTYAAATGAAGPLWVIVQRGRTQDGCTGVYTPDGERLRGAFEQETPGF